MGSVLTDDRAVFFFDIDVSQGSLSVGGGPAHDLCQNCLYPKSTNVHDHMAILINEYFVTHLDMLAEDATKLHHQYYKDYGLAIEGLSRHYQMDPMEFNHEVDDALPLDELLSPNPELRKLIQSFDTTKVKLWLFTNAHITHGKRVVKILGIDDLFEGITFCDYRQSPLVPKPQLAMFEKAEREASIHDFSKIYYVDDSHLNCAAAYIRGWQNSVHLVEQGVENPPSPACKHQISHLLQLLDLFPELLRPEARP